jgi:hypothetical protein
MGKFNVGNTYRITTASGPEVDARYLGFCIDRHLFENLDTPMEDGHFSLTDAEADKRVSELPF